MKKNLLNWYVEEELKSIEQNVSDFSSGKNPACLHCLRVDIKKIRAAYSFAEHMYQEKFSVAKLVPLFKNAGKIREIQLNSILLCSFTHPPKSLIVKLKKKELSLIQEFITNESLHQKHIKGFRKSLCLPKKLADTKTIKHYFEEEKRKANLCLRNKERESLHQYRTRLKKLMYNYNLLPEKLQKEIDLNYAPLEKLQKDLGDWHDLYSAISFISNEQLPIKTARDLLKLKNEESRQFHVLLSSLTETYADKTNPDILLLETQIPAFEEKASS